MHAVCTVCLCGWTDAVARHVSFSRITCSAVVMTGCR